MKKVGQLKKIQHLRAQKHKASLARMAKTQFEIDTIADDIETTEEERDELRRNGRTTLENAIEFAQQGYASSSKIINIAVTLNRHTRQLTDKAAKIKRLKERKLDVEQELFSRKGHYIQTFRELQKADELVARKTKIVRLKAENAEEDELSETPTRRYWNI